MKKKLLISSVNQHFMHFLNFYYYSYQLHIHINSF